MQPRHEHVFQGQHKRGLLAPRTRPSLNIVRGCVCPWCLPSGPNKTAVYPDSVDLSGYDIDGFRDVAIKAGWEEVSLGILEGLIKFFFCSDWTAPNKKYLTLCCISLTLIKGPSPNPLRKLCAGQESNKCARCKLLQSSIPDH